MRDALIIDYNFLDLIFSVACFFPPLFSGNNIFYIKRKNIQTRS